MTTVVTSEIISKVTELIDDVPGAVSENFSGEGVHSDMIRGLLEVQRIRRGRLTCILKVKPYVCNRFNSFHGGAVGSIAELVAIACARTVVAKDKELFLGELSVSYLAAAVNQAELIVEASVVRSGRNLTVVAIEFKNKDSERITYVSRATFYNTPAASL